MACSFAPSFREAFPPRARPPQKILSIKISWMIGSWLLRQFRAEALSVLLGITLILLLQRWVYVSVLQNFFQIGPYAQVRYVIGDRRKSMRHTLWYDDDVASF